MKRRKPLGPAWREYWVWHPLQGLAVFLVFGFVGLLPAARASALGGRLGRLLGPLARTPNERARRNLALAFPEKTEAEREAIRGDMWEHLGRVSAEYPHLLRLRDSEAVELAGVRHLIRWYGEKPIIFIGGHLGHWELGPAMAAQFGVSATAIYRPPNNRFVDRTTRRIREACGLTLLARGSESVRAALSVVQGGDNLALLVDQRRMYGIPVPFFGHEAMTGQVAAQLATRLDCLVVPVRVERLEGIRYRVTCHPPMPVARSGDREADIRELMTQVNALIESWVRERPAQWLWPHRRWDR
jgi:KDO2-lipid IV(A) lauroyltransferase